MNSTTHITTVFPWPESRDLHIISIVPASLTLMSTILGTFWFWSMQRKNFRQVLILMLILADGSKGLWIFVFSIVGLCTSSKIKSSSIFCQIGGFCLQYSFEACDLAVLLLTIHVSSQILLPAYTRLGREGLYGFRKWVFAIFVVLPAIDAAIPFARYPYNVAYSYDGAYCSLFTGPLWLSLSLSWVPRYLIWSLILIILVSLNIYIRSQSYARSLLVRESNFSDNLRPKQITKRGVAACLFCFKTAKRRLSISETEKENPQSPDETRVAPWLAISNDEVQPLQPINVSRSPRQQAQRLMLYPLVYILAWSVPFSAQCVAFSKTHSVNSIFALRASSVFCVSVLGVLDVLVFSWREKPWLHTASGDGTVIGSISGIRHLESSFSSRRPSVQQGVSYDSNNPIQPPAKTLRSHGRGSDHDRRLAQLAFERLALEQADAAQARARAPGDQPFTILPDVSSDSISP